MREKGHMDKSVKEKGPWGAVCWKRWTMEFSLYEREGHKKAVCVTRGSIGSSLCERGAVCTPKWGMGSSLEDRGNVTTLQLHYYCVGYKRWLYYILCRVQRGNFTVWCTVTDWGTTNVQSVCHYYFGGHYLSGTIVSSGTICVELFSGVTIVMTTISV